MQKFSILDKQKIDLYVGNLFDIFYSNMSLITPEEDYSNWTKIIKNNLNNPNRNIVLIYDNNILIGFFMYSIENNHILNMEEIQIKISYQGKGNVFRKLYGFIISLMPNGVKTVTACAHKLNIKSQEILKHMGLKFIRKDKDIFYCYQGTYEDLLKWYNHIINSTNM